MDKSRRWLRFAVPILLLAVAACQKVCPPGAKPIISIRPTIQGAMTIADWRVDNVVATPGAPGVIMPDAYGSGIDFFRATPTGGTATPINSVTIVVAPLPSGNNNTILIERSGTQFSWKLNNTPLTQCSPCSGSGLPPEFFGQLVSITANSVTNAPLSSPGLAEIHAQ